MSDYAKEQLPEVKEFNTTVISSLVTYIDGYISVLNTYKTVPAAKLEPAQIAVQVQKLESIKKGLTSP